MDVIVDSSVWIDALGGETIEAIEAAMTAGTLVLTPLVIAEVLSGELTWLQQERVGELLQDFPMHETPLEHWMNVGALRRRLASHGVNVTISDAHVAQCAIDRDAMLYSRDAIFALMAKHMPLRFTPAVG